MFSAFGVEHNDPTTLEKGLSGNQVTGLRRVARGRGGEDPLRRLYARNRLDAHHMGQGAAITPKSSRFRRVYEAEGRDAGVKAHAAQIMSTSKRPYRPLRGQG